MNGNAGRWSSPWLLPVSLALLILLSLIAVPVFLYQHFPHFARYPDTALVRQELRHQFAPTLCLATLNQTQALTTPRDDGYIWQRLPTRWFQPSSGFYGYGNEAYFERRLGRTVKLGSSVFYRSAPPRNELYVSNKIVIQLPIRLCQLWP